MSDDADNKSLGFPGTPIAVPVGPLAPAAPPGDAEEGLDAPDAGGARQHDEGEAPTGPPARLSHAAIADAIVDEGERVERATDRAAAGPAGIMLLAGGVSFGSYSAGLELAGLVALLVMVLAAMAIPWTIGAAQRDRRRLQARLTDEVAGGDDELVWAAYQAFTNERRRVRGGETSERSALVTAARQALKQEKPDARRPDATQRQRDERHRERNQRRAQSKKKKKKNNNNNNNNRQRQSAHERRKQRREGRR